MPAIKEIKLTSLGIVAGAGSLPVLLADFCEKNAITPVIIGLDGVTDPALLKNRTSLMTHIGALGAMVDFLKQHGATNLVMTGALKRPRWTSIRPDAAGIGLLAKLAVRWMGDDAVLKTVRRDLEKRGLILRGIQEFLPGLLTPAGVVGAITPTDADWTSIRIGYHAAVDLGRRDLGQSVAAQHGAVIAQEDDDGTNAMIARATALKIPGRGPVLVKICKPQQDRALDLPTIGPETIDRLSAAGFSGLVISAGDSLMIDRDECLRRAADTGIFLYGITPDDRNLTA